MTTTYHLWILLSWRHWVGPCWHLFWKLWNVMLVNLPSGYTFFIIFFMILLNCFSLSPYFQCYWHTWLIISHESFFINKVNIIMTLNGCLFNAFLIVQFISCKNLICEINSSQFWRVVVKFLHSYKPERRLSSDHYIHHMIRWLLLCRLLYTVLLHLHEKQHLLSHNSEKHL